MKRTSIISIIFLIVLLSSCSGVKGTKVNAENESEVLSSVGQSKSLTQEEKELVAAFFMRSKMGGMFGIKEAKAEGKTIGQIIEEQRAYVAEEKAKEEKEKLLAKEAKAKEEALLAELRKALTLTIYEKGFIPSNYRAGSYQDYITMKAAYQNDSGKEIRAFQGDVIFQDLFGDVIFESSLKITKPIKAGEKDTWEGVIDYNQFLDTHQKLRNTEMKDMKILWVPKTIIFSDGTKIGEEKQGE